MAIKELDQALLGQMFEVLDLAESSVPRGARDSISERLLDAVMLLRARLIAGHSQPGVYSAALLQAILESAVDAIVVIDSAGTVERFNLAAESLFGYAQSEVVGRNVSMLMPAPHREQHDQYISRYLQTGEAQVIGIGRAVTARRKDGSAFSVHLALSRLQVGRAEVFAGFLREISDPKTDG